MTPNELSHPHERLLFIGSGALIFLLLLIALGREQQWGWRHVRFYLQASDVSGLASGEQVRIAGLPVGQVGEMRMEPSAKVRVELLLDANQAHLIGPGSVASLNQDGLMGDRYVSISPDPQPKAALETQRGGTIRYSEPVSISTMLKELNATQLELQATLRNTTALTAQNGAINSTLSDLRSTIGSTGRLATQLDQQSRSTGPLLRESLQSVRTNIDAVSRQTTASEAEAQRFLSDTRPVLLSTLAEIRDVSRSSRQLLDRLLRVLGPLLEPADPAARQEALMNGASKPAR